MKKLSLFFAFISCVYLCLWAGFGGIFALNFTFALVSFLLIVFIVFYLQKRKIDSLIQNASKEELEALADAYKSKQERLEEEEEEFFAKDSNSLEQKTTKIPQLQGIPHSQGIPLKKRKFWHNFSLINTKTGVKMFFLPMRLFAYGFLVVGILLLIKQQSFDVFAFFSGLVVANLLILVMLLFARTH